MKGALTPLGTQVTHSLFRCIITVMPDQEFHNYSTVNRFTGKALLCQQRVKQYRVPMTQQAQVFTVPQYIQRGQGAQQRLRLLQSAHIQNTFSAHLFLLNPPASPLPAALWQTPCMLTLIWVNPRTDAVSLRIE
jgi:hypothetical protein